jgi:hypothetical protein
MNHASFHRLVAIIKGDAVFSNNSRCPQAPVEYQLLLTLRRLGMFGNGVSVGQMSQFFSVAGMSVETVVRGMLSGSSLADYWDLYRIIVGDSQTYS